MNIPKITYALFLFLIIGCTSDDGDPIKPDANKEVKIKEALLSDFQLTEITYKSITVVAPEITDNKETKHGNITITLPSTNTDFSLSLKSVGFNKSKFKISPDISVKQNFADEKSILYTISSVKDNNTVLHYNVTVIKETGSSTALKIKGFEFRKNKNTHLSVDITATKIVEYSSSEINAIYVLVPVDTDITNLVPTIDFEGANLFYEQGDVGLTEFPTTDLEVNFNSDYDYLNFLDKNEFSLTVKDSKSNSKKYRVIVDTEMPIALNTTTMEMPNITKGTTTNYSIKWTNKGNHPIPINIEAITYTDNTTDAKGNIFTAKLTAVDPLDGGYIKPGREGLVSVAINATSATVGNYDISTTFKVNYELDRALIHDWKDDLRHIEELFKPIAIATRIRVKEVEPETLKITSLKFEKSKNPSLPNNIEIARTIEGVGIDKIYLFVPVGTDFSNLTPTITYAGTKIYYNQGSGSTTEEYPESGKSIDFKYPKSFILEVKDKDNKESRLSQVIVDVVNPLKIETTKVTTPDTARDSNERYVATKWINQGNHLLVYGKADIQKDQIPVTPTEAIRVRRILPAVGLIPGDSRDVNVTVMAKTYPKGTYKTTAIFYPRIRYNEGIDDILEPAELHITSTIID